MAKMATCACGWTIITPTGEEEVAKLTRIHLQDYHPEASVSDAELRKMVKTV